MRPISNANHIRSASPEPNQATASTSSGVTVAEHYVKPLNPAHLDANRKKLKTSKNEAAEILGVALEKVHWQLINKKISDDDHLAECGKIQQAADALGLEPIDADDEALAAFGLKGKADLRLNSGQYGAILDDLSHQLSNDNSAFAARARLEVVARNEEAARNAAARGRENIQRQGNTLGGASAPESSFPSFSLTRDGFSQEEITRIGSRGGRGALMAVSLYFDRLTARGVSRDQITNMASSPEGDRALMAVDLHFDSLTARGFSRDQIIDMVSNPEEGARALEEAVR